MKAIIFAAGMGTRLVPYTIGIPKPLVPISMKNGIKVVIERLIDQIKVAGITEILIVVNYKKESIMDYLGNGSRFGVNIAYLYQEELNGQIGAMNLAKKFIGEDEFLVTDGDNYYGDDELFKKIIEFHKKSNAYATVNAVKVEDARTYAILKEDEKNNLLDIIEKPKEEKYWTNIAKLGIVVLKKEAFDIPLEKTKTEFGDHSITQLLKYLALEAKEIVKVYNIEGFFTDIGTWDSYDSFIKKMDFA